MRILDWLRGRPEDRVKRQVKEDLKAAKDSSEHTVKRLDQAIAKYRLLTELGGVEDLFGGANEPQ